MSTLSAMVLSAGLGTRLRPFTYECPKPLIPLCGRTLLEWNLQALKQVGIHHVGINTFHLAQQVPPALSQRSESFYWSHEDVLQGTGGGIRDLHHIMNHDTYVVINGDAFFDFSLHPLVDTHQKHDGIATLALRRVAKDDPFARIGLDAQGRVVRIAEVLGPRADQEVAVGAFTGVQIINQTVCQALPSGFCDVFRSAIKELLHQQADVFSYFVPNDSLWVDVGTPQRYVEAHQAVYHKRESRLWHDMPAYEWRNDGVCFEGAVVESSVKLGINTWIGAHAQITGKASLRDTIIWSKKQHHFEAIENKMQNVIISAKGVHHI